MKKLAVLVCVFITLIITKDACGMATEQIGSDKIDRPTCSQPSWPDGIVAVPRHPSRVYSMWCNGNEKFYFKSTDKEINQLIKDYCAARQRDYHIRFVSGTGKVKSFPRDRQEFEYNVCLNLPSGIFRHVQMEKDDEESAPVEPYLTIYIGKNLELPESIDLPKKVVVRCDIKGGKISSKAKRPKRDNYYCKVKYEDMSPVFNNATSLNIAWWDKGIDRSIELTTAGRGGAVKLRFSDQEIKRLYNKSSFLTLTTGNWLTKPAKTDPRLSVSSLSLDIKQAGEVIIPKIEYYYGRLLFEDGSPPFIKDWPWQGAGIMMDFAYAGSVELDKQGYFKLYFTDKQYQEVKGKKLQPNIYIPSYTEKNTSTAKQAFPFELLTKDKSKVKAFKIPYPGP